MTTDLTASMIAADLNATLVGPDRSIRGIAPLGEASEGMLTFAVDTVKFADQALTAVRRGAVLLIPSSAAAFEDENPSIIRVANPRAAFASAVERRFTRPRQSGIAATARIHPDAIVSPSASIGEYTVIRAGAVIGDRTEVRDHVVIGFDVKVGAECLIKSHAVIGEEGFGMEVDADGNNLRIPHVGSVVLADHVEVGGFTTVCSGTITPTRVGDYTKIDDHVHIAHNCQIGRNVIVTACAEISGSVVIGDRTWIGPNASVIQGVTLGEHSLLGIGAVAVKSVPADEVRIGNPARRLGDNRNSVQ